DLDDTIPVRDTAGPAPLSAGQERIWFLHQLDPGEWAYNIAITERLRGVLDADALERAFAEVVSRHDSLRTRFPAIDGQPVQRVEPHARVNLERLHADNADHARELVSERTKTAFDLTTGPLLRGALIRLAADDPVLCL